jgi:hypothetical protein
MAYLGRQHALLAAASHASSVDDGLYHTITIGEYFNSVYY